MITKRNMDFLCVGFEKAGTTSLDTILRQHSLINLPKIKETQYFYWDYKYENAKEVLWERYFSDKAGIYGAIEPEFEYFPKEIQREFGKDVKLLFIMRNPVNRLFSSYRMELRRGAKVVIEQYKERKSVSLMFEKFVVNHMVYNKRGTAKLFVERGKYMRVIREFMNYFPHENMKFIIFEEFILNPQKYIIEIQNFLGIPIERLNCNVKENEGNRVSRNYGCAYLNALIISLNFQLWTNKDFPISLYMKWKIFLDKIMQYTTVEIRSQMNHRTQKICEQFYREDKEELEKFLKKDLSQLWFS